jgi:6-phosphofructokinase
MKNPFMDFRPGSYRKKENPAQRIARENQGRLEGIIKSYLCLVEEEIKDLSWVVEHSRVVKAYGTAVERLRNLKFDQEDIFRRKTTFNSDSRISNEHCISWVTD